MEVLVQNERKELLGRYEMQLEHIRAKDVGAVLKGMGFHRVRAVEDGYGDAELRHKLNTEFVNIYIYANNEAIVEVVEPSQGVDPIVSITGFGNSAPRIYEEFHARLLDYLIENMARIQINEGMFRDALTLVGASDIREETRRMVKKELSIIVKNSLMDIMRVASARVVSNA